MGQHQGQQAPGNVHPGKQGEQGNAQHNFRDDHGYVQQGVHRSPAPEFVAVHAHGGQGADAHGQHRAAHGNDHGIAEGPQKGGIVKELKIPVEGEALPRHIGLGGGGIEGVCHNHADGQKQKEVDQAAVDDGHALFHAFFMRSLHRYTPRFSMSPPHFW
ncbi:hypothetical protein SDC9_160354 [bioreactor metagenome]|uniref:Uncharacterized protein n=1 Tax=bioreactor metagenome TaxID=1076179 RepID=A0A645FKU0_9ZZZZ